MHKFYGTVEGNRIDSVAPGRPSQSRRHLGKSWRRGRSSLSGVWALKVENRMTKSTNTLKHGASSYFYSFQMRQVRNPGRDRCLGGCSLQGQTSQLRPATSRSFRTAEAGWLNHEGKTSWGGKYSHGNETVDSEPNCRLSRLSGNMISGGGTIFF